MLQVGAPAQAPWGRRWPSMRLPEQAREPAGVLTTCGRGNAACECSGSCRLQALCSGPRGSTQQANAEAQGCKQVPAPPPNCAWASRSVASLASRRRQEPLLTAALSVRRSSDLHGLGADPMVAARWAESRSGLCGCSPRLVLTNVGHSHCCRAACLAPGASSLGTPARARIAGAITSMLLAAAAAACRSAGPTAADDTLPSCLQASPKPPSCDLCQHSSSSSNRSGSGKRHRCSRMCGSGSGSGCVARGCKPRQMRQGRHPPAAAS